MLRITAVLNEENATVIDSRKFAKTAADFCDHYFTQYKARFEFKSYPDGEGGLRAYVDGGYVIELLSRDPKTGTEVIQYAMIEDC